ncbi:MAG TPA: hypothetical protein VF815_12465 [Myxococcaceae bacterium]|jgi:hypothetical protein
MRFMFVVALIFAGVIALLPWINASLDEAGLKQDAAFAPELSRTGSAIKAPMVAHYLMRVAKERGLELQPENLNIRVSESKAGTLAVRGGPIKLGANQQVPIQQVTITIDYNRPIYLGLTKKIAFTVDTEGVGDGGLSTYPVPTPTKQEEVEEEEESPSEAEAPSDMEAPAGG